MDQDHLENSIIKKNNHQGVHFKVDPLAIKYVNRLWDLIYTLARYLEEEETKVQFKI